ncbi:MAG: sarcosine oxidase subunit beta family protein [Porticoccaceae bacterium]|nr:sarcosine oxidase subunit beta family protein [Porticoccaceae bacterium]
MERYSAFGLVKHALTGHKKWPEVWRSPEPKPEYDVIIVGGGGHGLATAYNLAKNYKGKRVAILEKNWIGSGNTGRNTTIVRSDYYYKPSAEFFKYSLSLYGKLSKELNYNVMFSKRGSLTLSHSRDDFDFQRRLVNAMQLNGIDIRHIGLAEIKKICPILNFSKDARYPIHGAMWEPGAGTVRHDAVVWGYARAADALGVDIIQNCEVTGINKDLQTGAVTGLETSRGKINAKTIGLAVAGHSTELAAMAGFRLPIRSMALQAFVSEPVKPVLNTVISSRAISSYASQSDRGGLVMGGGVDPYNSYAQKGNTPVLEEVLSGLIELVPSFSRVRLLRQWAGIVDYTYDSSPIIGPSPVPGLFLNCGWGGGGFKAIPAGGEAFAHLLATGQVPPLVEAFSLSRFKDARLVDEAAGAGIAH